MSIGGYIQPKNSTSQTYTVDYKQNSYFYSINVNGLYVDNIQTKLTRQDFNSGQGSFIDSGTTLTYFPYEIFNTIVHNILSFCRLDFNCGDQNYINEYDRCFSLNGADKDSFFSTFPNITFKLDNGFDYVWTPQNYLYFNYGRYCLAFEELDHVILGGTWMRGHDILFDRKNSQIKFTKSNCDYDQLD